MYSFKEKKRHFSELHAPGMACHDLGLLRLLSPNNPDLNTYERNPTRHADAILFSLLDIATREDIRAHRRASITKDLQESTGEIETQVEGKDSQEVVEEIQSQTEETQEHVQELQELVEEAEEHIQELQELVEEAQVRAEEAEERAQVAEAELQEEKKKVRTRKSKNMKSIQT